MKILQVNSVYKKGSTGKIVCDLHSELEIRGIESVVCYGRGQIVKEKRIYRICSDTYAKLNHLISKFNGIIYGGCLISTYKLINIIKREKPDVVHLHCINGYFVNIYKIITWLKDNNINTVITLHADFMFTGGCSIAEQCEQWGGLYGCGKSKCPYFKERIDSLIFDRTKKMWNLMNEAFTNFNKNLIIVSVSPWLQRRAENSAILYDKRHTTVFNGVNTDIFHYHDSDKIRSCMQIECRKIVLHVTPWFSLDKNHLKGGYYVNEVAKLLAKENITVYVAGNYDDSLTYSDNIVFLGNVTDQNVLAQYYSLADVSIITSKCETFSMVVAESLCCGTPVAGFKAGGPEEIAIHEYSRFVEYGNVYALGRCICQLINNPKDKKLISKYSIRKYEKARMCNNYLEIYSKLDNSFSVYIEE